MSAMLVHDLKNPITVMLANVDYLLQAAEPAAQGESLSALHDTQVAGRRALRLLGNLLDVARLESSQLQLRREYTDVARLLGPLVEQRSHMAVSRDISMRCHLDRGATVYADTELISRVVENVFDNAFRHTPVGGVIDVQGFATSHGAQLRIGNSGAAIPSEARQQIFERFAQAHEHVGRMNLGLGLYFCRLATEAHGGRIWVEETRDLPTVFSIELPA
jgi:signal transduction histidine kinase